MGCCNSAEKSTEIDSEVYEAYELEEKKFGLAQNEIDFLMTHTKYGSETIKDWYKNFMQENPSGKISENTFGDFYDKMFPCPNLDGNAKDFEKHVFRSVST